MALHVDLVPDPVQSLSAAVNEDTPSVTLSWRTPRKYSRCWRTYWISHSFQAIWKQRICWNNRDKLHL